MSSCDDIQSCILGEGDDLFDLFKELKDRLEEDLEFDEEILT